MLSNPLQFPQVRGVTLALRDSVEALEFLRPRDALGDARGALRFLATPRAHGSGAEDGQALLAMQDGVEFFGAPYCVAIQRPCAVFIWQPVQMG